MGIFDKQKVTFNALKKLSVKDRMKAVQEPAVGPLILSSLTPTDYAALFPKYYQQRLPDIGGFNLAVSRQSTQQQASLSESISQRLEEVEKTGQRWAKKLKDKVTDLKEDISEKVTGGSKVPQLSDDAKKAWEKIQSGDVDINSPEGKVITRLSQKQLDELGISRSKDQKGNESFHYTAPTAGKEEVQSRYEQERGSGLTGRERAVIRMISAREGAKDPNTVLGNGAYGFPPKPLTQMTINEVIDYQQILRANSLKDPKMARRTNYKGSSAVGKGQFIEDTLKRNLIAIGIPESKWSTTKFDEKLQDRLIIQNFKSNVGDPNEPSSWNRRALGKQWESFKEEAGFPALKSTEVSDILKESKNRIIDTTQGARDITKEEYDKLSETIKKEKNQAKAALFARDMFQYERDNGLPHAQSTKVLNNSGYVVDSNGHIQPTDGRLFDSKNANQCATLTKAFNPGVGRASGWKVSRNDSLIKPGVAVATSMYNNSSGGTPAAGYHTGIALTAPDKKGDFYILDQFSPNANSNGQASVRKANVNEYHHSGNFWGVINGDTSVSIAALKYAQQIGAPSDALTQINTSISDYENKAQKDQVKVAEPDKQQLDTTITENKPKVETLSAVTFDPSKPPPPGTHWQMQGNEKVLYDDKSGAGVYQMQGSARYKEISDYYSKLAQTAPAAQTNVPPPTAKVEKPAGPQSFNLNRQALIGAIKQTAEYKKKTAGVPDWVVPDDSVVNGFFDDARTKQIMKDTGTTYDPATGKVTSSNPEKLLKSFGDMNTSNILAPEKRAAATPSTQTASVTKGSALGFVQPANAGELDFNDPAVRERILAARSQTMAKTQSFDIDRTMAIIRRQESYTFAGKYDARSKTSTASGAYQFLNNTWKEVTGKYNIGKQYKTAGAAPKEVQDEVMRRYLTDLYNKHGDLETVLKVHFTGNPEGRMSKKAMAANKGMTGSEYVQNIIGKHGPEYDKMMAQNAPATQPTQVAQVPTPTPEAPKSTIDTMKETASKAASYLTQSPTSKAETKTPTGAPSATPTAAPKKEVTAPLPPQRPAEFKAPQAGAPAGESSTSNFLKSQGIGVKEKVPGAAMGGQFNVPDGGVDVFPANVARGDNLVGVNSQTGQPLFTMGSDENVSYNRNTNNVSISPAGRPTDAPGPQPDRVSSELDAIKQQLDASFSERAGKVADMKQIQSPPATPNGDPDYLFRMGSMAEKGFQTPSMKRAMSRTRGVETGDGTDGHHFSKTSIA